MNARNVKAILGITCTTLVAIALGVFDTYLAMNEAASTKDFLFGPVGLILVGVTILAFVLAAHKSTGTLVGTLIGLAAAGLLMFAAVAWKPFENITWSSFLFGICVGLPVLLAALAVSYVGARYYHRIHN